MIKWLSIVLGFQLFGELVRVSLGLLVPGPIIGMVGLFAFLFWKKAVPADLLPISRALLGHLAVLFVPAGVGVMLYADVFREYGVALAGAVVVSTLVGIAVTAAVMAALTRGKGLPQRDVP